ncbi:LysM peptidoglycan-binding domain-containing M23 family metallopeptidase [Zavarzinia aquatilis]|nr:LysM peptidoglycan-binding domain-containing M23 family metallopeptidase [Zavarzinia aquatilis]
MVRSGPYPVIRLAAWLAGTLLLASCGGRTELAPVEYVGGGSPSSSSTGTITGGGSDGPMPEIEAAPLAPVSRGGGITATPLDSPAATPVETAPVETPAPAISPGAEAAPAGTTTVAPGETLSAVARRTGVPMRDLILANNLAAPFTVQPGQVLQLPQVRYHTVVAGDTVYNISRRYGVDQASLMAENGISPPFTVKLGQKLRIPGQVQAPAPTTTPTPASTVAAPVAVPAAAEPVENPAPVPEIIEPDPDSLPPPKPAADAATAPALAMTEVPQPARKPVPPPVAAPTAAAAATVPARPGSASSEAPSAGDMRFVWPVAGDVISEFGAKPGGQHNDGINIQAAQGTTVRAAESGVVAYAGNEIRGFGNLVLIRHAGGWMTAYAHNATLLVKQGDKVVRGQQIARVGHTGNVTVPQLHFEVRKGRTPVDPLKYLDGNAG